MTANKYSLQSMERVNELIQFECGGSQQDFANKTGIQKASVSQYANGKNAPTNLTAAKIAEAFNINPAWVMGFDVPKYGQTNVTEDDQRRDYLFTKYGALFSDLDGLPEDQQKEVENFIKFKLLSMSEE